MPSQGPTSLVSEGPGPPIGWPALEDSGWVLRDCLNWIYGQGFPKSHNVSIMLDKADGLLAHRGKAIVTTGSYEEGQQGLENPKGMERHVPIGEAAKQWDGWGTALKPAWEPIYLARKPFSGTVAENIRQYGTGGLNVDGCRVDGGPVGRWPANLLHDGSPEALEVFPDAPGQLCDASAEAPSSRTGGIYGAMRRQGPREGATSIAMGPGLRRADSGSASRFFYCAKASKREREEGLEAFGAVAVGDGRDTPADNAFQRGKTQRKNICPTVKPVALMRYLCRLICPPGGLVLDPFCGSGSTGVAALQEGFHFLGVTLDYADISEARCSGAVSR